MADHDQLKPLALPATPFPPQTTTTTTVDGESATAVTHPGFYRRHRRCVLWSLGCCGATVVVLAFLILVLALTVFRVKDPVLTMNSIYLDDLSVGYRGSIDRLVSINATLVADISIKNPNAASFRFGNSTTEFYYMGEVVGAAYAPDGVARARRTVRMNVTVDVLIDRAAAGSATGAVLRGEVEMGTYTDIAGRVSVMGGVYKKKMEIELRCNVTLGVTVVKQEIRKKACLADVK